MKRRDLTPEKIIITYIALAEKMGLAQVSFPRLAEALAIKPPSLYNHFKNLTDLKVHTAIFLHERLHEYLTSQLIGKTKEAALLAYGEAYRRFALKYQAVYELLNTIPSFNNDALLLAGRKNTSLLSQLLASFGLSEEEVLMESRGFRSLLHGYVSLSQLGYFQNVMLDSDESFVAVLTQFVQTIARKAKE
ncbi:TetR family transcriptional regulator [Enterococcus saigonensis]|uniref:TetR family transcriptional regulator n=1 Tax=Enterococcus saigonensis TaxID=1805431 RepID=A0A679IK85_9ENTE|nr:TetR/AcrR family transcriptional regulator [Enterococcus saigonensis]BCA85031.1 TetR family transcriptional regulator [Enterococcus saigonensis]